MPPWENAGPKFGVGKVSPGLEGVGAREVVGTAECSDGASQAIPGVNRVHFRERKIGSQGRQQSRYQFRASHDRGRRAAKAIQNGEQIVIGPRALRRPIGGSAGTPAAGNEQMHSSPAVD